MTESGFATNHLLKLYQIILAETKWSKPFFLSIVTATENWKLSLEKYLSRIGFKFFVWNNFNKFL